jgi:hypothetical protein
MSRTASITASSTTQTATAKPIAKTIVPARLRNRSDIGTRVTAHDSVPTLRRRVLICETTHVLGHLWDIPQYHGVGRQPPIWRLTHVCKIIEAACKILRRCHCSARQGRSPRFCSRDVAELIEQSYRARIRGVVGNCERDSALPG